MILQMFEPFICSQAKLQPTDNINVYYKASSKLSSIITSFSDFINDTVKQPLKPYPVPPQQEVVITENSPVSFRHVHDMCLVRF